MMASKGADWPGDEIDILYKEQRIRTLRRVRGRNEAGFRGLPEEPMSE